MNVKPDFWPEWVSGDVTPEQKGFHLQSIVVSMVYESTWKTNQLHSGSLLSHTILVCYISVIYKYFYTLTPLWPWIWVWSRPDLQNWSVCRSEPSFMDLFHHHKADFLCFHDWCCRKKKRKKKKWRLFLIKLLYCHQIHICMAEKQREKEHEAAAFHQRGLELLRMHVNVIIDNIQVLLSWSRERIQLEQITILLFSSRSIKMEWADLGTRRWSVFSCTARHLSEFCCRWDAKVMQQGGRSVTQSLMKMKRSLFLLLLMTQRRKQNLV